MFVSELQGDVDGGFVDSMKVFSCFFDFFLWNDYQIVNFVLRNIGFVDSRGWSTKPFVFLPYLCNRKSEEMRLVPEKDSEEMTLVGVITFLNE